ncbi:aminotransferase class III-fold pyridoxal phosphate-dependent enzyme [Rubripirellula sp.]|nr:aminotransferase class III-fold pyridoxal phosphate-dependent enzyme [Rubripirellula sp.]MDB4338776.1 aminotransferase class III-fold pyridoxal phosphate-dependent enzyme [Rubripirellula sp.]
MAASNLPSLNLIADAFKNDPRIAEARRLVSEAIADHSSNVKGVRKANPVYQADYEAMLERLTAVRGVPPIWPYLASGMGSGPFVELADGSVKLDFICGIGVHGCGHLDETMVQAGIDAALEDTVMQGNLQQNPASLQMGERLVELACQSGAKLEHCLLSTSGAMANENALKIAFHNKTPADRIIAFDNAFAGRTLATAALTDKASYRSGLPVTINVDYLPFRDPHQPERSQRWAVDELHRLLNRFPGKHAAFWAEPIAGEGGYYEGTHDFFRAICEPLRQNNIPIIFDEVQSFSRTSQPFTFQHLGLDDFADIVTVGKITQVCATLYGKSFNPTGPILSQTFTGSSASIATGLVMLEQLESTGCFGPDGANLIRGQHFQRGLQQLAQKHPKLLSGPFGTGMMVAFTPGDGSFEQAKELMGIMYEVGLLGFVCGANPTRIRFLPPPR